MVQQWLCTIFPKNNAKTLHIYLVLVGIESWKIFKMFNLEILWIKCGLIALAIVSMGQRQISVLCNPECVLSNRYDIPFYLFLLL